MRSRILLTFFTVAALAGWGGGAAGLFAYLNWFGETNRTGGGTLLVSSWFLLLLGLAATFGFAATTAFEVVDRVRRRA